MNKEKFIYLDNNSTTRLDPAVYDAMAPWFMEFYGNSSSPNSNGIAAAAAVENARRKIASIFAFQDGEILFAPSSTLSINTAIAGVAFSGYPAKDHLITQATEHPAVLETMKYLRTLGFNVTILPVDYNGLIDLDQLRDSITDKTLLVSLMAANNEIGTLQPLRDAGNICKERGVLFHSDVTQAAGRYDLNAEELNLDLISGGGHKIHGPKGTGYLAIRKKSLLKKITPVYHGGGQEAALFPGTLNVPLIVGLSRALELSCANRESENRHLSGLSLLFREILESEGIDFRLNGPENRLVNNLSIRFRGIKSSHLIGSIKNVAFSAGSACASGNESHVLKAIGLTTDEINSTLRFGFSRFNTVEEVKEASLIFANFIKSKR